MSRTAAWTRRSISDERARNAAREELEHGFRGAPTEADIARYARALEIVDGPAPEPGWDRFEPSTYGGD